MNILFITSKKLRLTNALATLDQMGHTLALYPVQAEVLRNDEEQEEKFGVFLSKNKVDFVLSHVFLPVLARQTQKHSVKLAVYGMDSPMYNTWMHNISQYDNCYFFYFDYNEYQMRRKLGMTNAYYLPLAGDVEQAEKLVITEEEIEQYKCDISFVGSLYTENMYDRYVETLPDRFRNLFNIMMEKCTLRWDGEDSLTPFITSEMAKLIKRLCPAMNKDLKLYDMPEEYYMKQWFFAKKMTNIERTLLMGLLAENYDLHLYTRKNEKVPDNVMRFQEIYHEDAYKVFYTSKINLNITLRSIESGVPLRVFDIMSVGGFVLSNYQKEMTELFEEDKEIVLFRTPEEMMDKIAYYLAHEEERLRIGINGYRRVKECYTYEHQLRKIISVLFPEKYDKRSLGSDYENFVY